MKVTFRNENGAENVIKLLRHFGSVRKTKPTHADAQTVIIHLPLPSHFSGTARLEAASRNREAYSLIDRFGIVIETTP